MAYTTIDDPSAYFQTLLYSGNASNNRALTNDGNSDLQPDWVWIKERSSTSAHKLLDSTRGVGKALGSNTDSVEESFAFLSSFDSDGFTIGTSDGSTNASGDTYVAWQWKCNGGTTSTNSDGNGNNVTIQVNSTAGFSIMKWTGDGSNTSTVGHGLGVKPNVIIFKMLEDSQNWSVAFPYFETSKLLALNTNSAFFSASGLSGYGSSTFVDGNGSSSEDFIAYCFKNIQGYSKFDGYSGNGQLNGPFIYTGFKPAWLMIKRTDGGNNEWTIFNNKSDPYNEMTKNINASTNGAEDTNTAYDDCDFLSNGFKIREDNDDINNSSGTYVYMAFAESPFVSSEGVPCTAR